MAPLSRQAWEKGSVLVQAWEAPARSSLTTHSPKSSPGEAQAPGGHTLHSSVPVLGVPRRHSPKQIHQYILQLMLHRKKSHKPFASVDPTILPNPLFFPRNCCLPVKSLVTPAAANLKLSIIFPIVLGDNSQKELYGVSVLFVFSQ